MAEQVSQAEQEKALGMAQQEMEYRVDLFNRSESKIYHGHRYGVAKSCLCINLIFAF